jgi:hypothetical protein
MDDGLFGATIHGLRLMGSEMLPGHAREGYGLANLVLFCGIWPGGMYALYLLALWQRRKIVQFEHQENAP